MINGRNNASAERDLQLANNNDNVEIVDVQ